MEGLNRSLANGSSVPVRHCKPGQMEMLFPAYEPVGK